MTASNISLFLPCAAGRTSLRRLRATDLADFQGYRGDAEVARYQGWSSMSDADALGFLNGMGAASELRPEEWWQLGIAELPTDRLVGDIGLHLAESSVEVEIGFSLARAAQGRGLAADALKAVIAQLFEAAPITRIIAVTDARNGPANRLLHKLGFECRATEEAVFKGETCTEHTFSLGRRPAEPASAEAMAALAKQAQELGLGYE